MQMKTAKSDASSTAAITSMDWTASLPPPPPPLSSPPSEADSMCFSSSSGFVTTLFLPCPLAAAACRYLPNASAPPSGGQRHIRDAVSASRRLSDANLAIFVVGSSMTDRTGLHFVPRKEAKIRSDSFRCFLFSRFSPHSQFLEKIWSASFCLFLSRGPLHPLVPEVVCELHEKDLGRGRRGGSALGPLSVWEEEEEEKRDKRDSHRGGREREPSSSVSRSEGRPQGIGAQRGRGEGKRKEEISRASGGCRMRRRLCWLYIQYPRRLQSLFIVRCDSKVEMTPKKNTIPNPKVPSCPFPFPSSIQVFLFPAAAASKRFYDEGKAK